MTDNRATERLRKLLDERGVEWSKPNDVIMDIDGGIGSKMTYWGDDWQYCAIVNYGGHLSLSDLTPEQAIAATLGSGTCEYAIKDNMNETEGMGDVWIECSACHFTFDYHGGKWLMNMYYCPNCGKVVEQ